MYTWYTSKSKLGHPGYDFATKKPRYDVKEGSFSLLQPYSLSIYIVYLLSSYCTVHQDKPDPPDSILDDPIESISSMKIIEGACSLCNNGKKIIFPIHNKTTILRLNAHSLPGHNEQFSYHPSTFSNKFLNKFRSGDPDECARSMVSYSSR